MPWDRFPRSPPHPRRLLFLSLVIAAVFSSTARPAKAARFSSASSRSIDESGTSNPAASAASDGASGGSLRRAMLPHATAGRSAGGATPEAAALQVLEGRSLLQSASSSDGSGA